MTHSSHAPFFLKNRWNLPTGDCRWARIVRYGLVGLGFFSAGLEVVQGQQNLIYDWERAYYGKINGEERLVYTGTFARVQMSFADLEGDGDDDLMVGKADGHLAFFENTGDAERSNFELKTEYFEAMHMESGEDGEARPVQKRIDVGANAAPTFVDIDADGDLDLFIGSQGGTIFYYENVGNALLPLFELKNPAYMSLRPGNNSVPRFQDVNTDRAPDLLVGTRQGRVYLYQNAGIPTQARFCGTAQSSAQNGRACPFPRETVGNTFPEVDASPAWVDWNHDGLWDFAVGKASGQISFYYNKGSAFAPRWELESDRFLFIDAGGYASPVFYDTNRDGFSELLVGTSSSNVVYYENREVLQTALKKIPDLDLAEIDWHEDHSSILERVCDELGGTPDCLPALARAFRIPPETPTTLQSYGDFIVKIKTEAPPNPATDVANENQGDGQPPARLIRRFNNRLIPAQVNAPDGNIGDGQGGQTANSGTASAAFPLAMANRNHLWIANRNFLKFFHFLDGDRRAVVTTGDWNNDGDLDLLLGSESGNLFAYENIGNARSPSWSRLNLPLFRANQRSDTAPNLVDIDDDGDLDILVGNHLGKLELMRNEGTPVSPDWKLTTLSFENIDVGSDSIPALVDLEKDGDLDLFVGNRQGQIIFYENFGTPGNPQYTLTNIQFANVIESAHAAPAFFFWNPDDNPDLLLGGEEGRVALIANDLQENMLLAQGWNLQDANWSQIETTGFSTPHVADFDQDQREDLFVGDGDGNVLLWLNRGVEQIEEAPPAPPVVVNNSIEMEPEEVVFDEDGQLVEEVLFQEEPVDVPFDPQYVLVTTQFIPLPNAHRIVPAFFDADADGDLDVIVGTRNGQLYYFSNEGNLAEPQWAEITDRFLGYEGGPNASPVFADVDQDGDEDFMVGNAQGNLLYWENQGSDDFPEFVPNPNLFNGVTGGVNSRPAFIDINQDGLLDLVIGNFRGQLVYYLQQLTEAGRSFQLIQRRYLGLDVGIGSSPTAADLDNDKRLDLVIGSDHGEIFAYRPIPIEEDPMGWGWEREVGYFNDLQTPLGNFPAFADMDQDGDLDLFIGGDDGSFYFYRNEGEPIVPSPVNEG